MTMKKYIIPAMSISNAELTTTILEGSINLNTEPTTEQLAPEENEGIWESGFNW